MRRRSARRKLKLNQEGYSTTEVVCITFLVVVAALCLIGAFLWYRDSMHKTSDQTIANTAESVAYSNMAGGCIVNDCGGSSGCEHQTAEGNVGYFDHPTNKIYGEKKAGYNEYKVMTIGDRKFYGDPGTMVLKVVAKDGAVTLSWVKGAE
ncbi:MAG: hypothetical protein PHG16_04240 [Lachnospiraceae bacterium]|nr:hypothetical protein [Lachnospiraceae bacterium]